MFAAGGILPWHQTQPGRELAPTAEAARFYHRGGDGCGDDRADAWNARQALADGVALVPVHQLLLDRQLEAVPHFFRNCLHCEQFLRESEHHNGLPIWTLPLHGGARPKAFSCAVTHCPRVFWMRLPGLVARACFRWRLWKQTSRRTNLEGAPSRGLRHGHVGSDDGPYRGDCSETVDMA